MNASRSMVELKSIRGDYNQNIIRNEVRRGQVWEVDLGEYIGSVQGGRRPCVVVQNDVGNKFSPTTIIIPLTSRLSKNSLPTHTMMTDTIFLKSLSLALGEQPRTIDNNMQLIKYLGDVSEAKMEEIDIAIEKSLGLEKKFNYDKAYEFLNSLSRNSNLINKFGKDKDLLIERQCIKNNFKTYCKEYFKNPEIIMQEYQEDKKEYIEQKLLQVK